ncbi:RNA polymerase sigma factor SigC [Williamsia sp. CHRR-6]|uniref:RNA polymerase sigma factor SigC n=1 Tax=Williamsia sp. CHRR-6 TaxID=2835871 RepID=UPI001BDA770E|nr:RNA polymerase sigma factor SigC [Williamsia sp. CHRR-6]MBT0567238.1 RNA polymerase sigma factor SigC [Williamsia sp. CHRR-6]
MRADAADDEHVTSLAFAAARGDRAALEAFIKATQADVWRFVTYLSDAGRADDLTQETYIRAIGALPRFSGRSTARTWLLSIARRVVVDQVRHDRARPPSAFGSGADAVVELPVAHRYEEQVEWDLLVNQLEPTRREAFLLTQFLGLSYADAADVCGCPVGTIRSRVARARDDLVRAYHADVTETG